LAASCRTLFSYSFLSEINLRGQDTKLQQRDAADNATSTSPAKHQQETPRTNGTPPPVRGCFGSGCPAAPARPHQRTRRTTDYTAQRQQLADARHTRTWMPISTCLTVMAARQSSSSFRMLRQTVPDGYTLGWNSGGLNLHFGGLLGYSSVNSIVSGYTPPSQIVPALPGMPHFLQNAAERSTSLKPLH
jgi:hypothetical protein